MGDLPSYPREAAEREEAAGPAAPEHEYAGWWSRAGAYLLDAVVISVIPFAVFFVLAVGVDTDDERTAASLVFLYLAILVLPFVYFTWLHGNERGQTLGKRATNIRVVAADGGPLGYGRAFGRYAITFVFGLFVLPLLLDYLWPLWDERNQSLHDKVAGTVVVRA